MESMSHDEATSRRAAQDEILIAGLASGLSYEEAGKKAGCVGRTVARKMQDLDFARQVASRRGEHVLAVAGQLTSLSAEAVEVIRGCTQDESARTRLGGQDPFGTGGEVP